MTILDRTRLVLAGRWPRHGTSDALSPAQTRLGRGRPHPAVRRLRLPVPRPAGPSAWHRRPARGPAGPGHLQPVRGTARGREVAAVPRRGRCHYCRALRS